MQWLKVFLKTLETEQIYRNTFTSNNWKLIYLNIEIWYNRKTRYSILDYKIIEGSGNRKIFLKMWNN
jgi:hypothetical protein